MNTATYAVLQKALIGFFIAWIGMIIGILLSFLANNRHNRFTGSILAFLGGIMVALISFELIPESFEIGSIYLGIYGMLSGLFVAILLDMDFMGHNSHKIIDKNNRFFHVALVMSIGIAIHNVATGIPLGSLFNFPSGKSIGHISIFLVHGIPEGLAVGLFLNKSKARFFTILMFSVLSSIPMGIGTLFGGIISSVSSSILPISLSFTSGLILYIVYREILPMSWNFWKGRLSAISNVIGIIIGIMFISLLH